MKTVLLGDFESMAYKVIQAIELEAWNHNNTISPSIGLPILEEYQTLVDCYVYFYDSKRDIKCGIYNGSTLLCNGKTLTPDRCGFLIEASKSEAFDMIGMIPCSPDFCLSRMVGIANEIRIISNNRVEITLNQESVLVIIARISAGEVNNLKRERNRA
ncbi:hypothetical protein [Lacrimispora defluvii]|uniref:Uncharacterized protein n=1 Tax=Lacrimispora defluvii TaxID=2719233 RepID=A0ABX1VMQ7_9FIRM|nr:hypothetical protein [Lacrimispora defluvii]NNJ29683.1 hypothetical protein [Lacrimispora defluvii]